MLSTVLATIARHHMVPAGARVVTRVIAAVSGGPDSVCLVHVLRDLAPLLGFHLAGIAHINHQLRGAASDEDQCFVASLADRLGLPLHTVSASPGSEGNLEQNARRIRRNFFRELIAAGAGDVVALGHTKDDQAETVLFRLLRGTGTTGLAGILPVTADHIIRPLLDVRRAEVRAYLREHQLPWREDASNASPVFARNRIRHTLLPQLEAEWNPQLSSTLAHMADVAYEEELYWAAEVARLAPGLMCLREGAVELDAAGLALQPRALARRLIRHAIRQVKGNLRGIDFSHVERVLQMTSPARITLPGLTVTRSLDWIRLAPPARSSPPAALTLLEPGTYHWPLPDPMICVEIAASNPAYMSAFRELAVELRGWQPGDQYQPVGRNRAVKLKELFQDARVPSWRRGRWPILTSGGKIVWAWQFGPALGAWPVQVVHAIPAGGNEPS